MPPSPSEAVARAIASMPRDGSINDFTTHFVDSLERQGFEIVAAAPVPFRRGDNVRVSRESAGGFVPGDTGEVAHVYRDIPRPVRVVADDSRWGFYDVGELELVKEAAEAPSGQLTPPVITTAAKTSAATGRELTP